MRPILIILAIGGMIHLVLEVQLREIRSRQVIPTGAIPLEIEDTAVRTSRGLYCTPQEMKALVKFITIHPEEWNKWAKVHNHTLSY